ncbi:lysoplasmalogenase-like protein TMEM86A [Branchiostoma floridae]|uniref:lysoplasmalogenase n=1 Tax=Branchiostoma floridae TaxID=7739 RepID=A0A9J7HT97_BRAFL|nr:lysoplasmalogenase-like protein TMEM86A [Branchiostoma floridae]
MKTFGLFVFSMTAYLTSVYTRTPNETVAVVLKSLPVATLAVFVQVEKRCHTAYARLLAAGLMFSAVGDFCLFWQHLPQWFIFGLLAFAVAQLLYALAFDVTHVTFDGTTVVTMATAVLTYAYILPGLKGAMTSLVGLYVILIFSMTAAATSCLRRDVTWPRLSACVGAVLFVVSDFVLAVNKFRFPLPHARFLNLSTYFAAQCLIAFSVLESEQDPKALGTPKRRGKEN